MRMLKLRWPDVRASIHVDDVTVQVNGQDLDQVARTTATIGEALHDAFAQLHLPFAADKAVLITNSVQLARKIHTKLGKKAGTIKSQTRSLGLDLTLKKIKARKVQGERIKEFARRVRRLETIRRRNYPAKRLFYGGNHTGSHIWC